MGSCTDTINQPTDCGETCKRASLCYACSAEIAAQAEPVAWRIFDAGEYEYSDDLLSAEVARHKRYGRSHEPLYAAPQPARQPLTEEQIDAEMNRLVQPFPSLRTAFFEGCRFAEQEHGIGGKE
jgi:hypothetical protein